MDNRLLLFLKKHQVRAYGEGQVIVRPEQESKHVFFITSGFVRAHSLTEEGNEFSAVLLGPGMYFPVFRYISDSSYIKNMATKYYYSTVTGASVITVSTTDLVQFLESHRQIAVSLADAYYKNMKLLQSKLEFMAYTHSAYKRVCYFLLFLCKRFGQFMEGGVRLSMPMTHKEFATFVGLSRESVSHQLSLLREKGIMEEASRPLFTIRNIQLLEQELRK